MAIRTETYELNGRQFTRTWSDANRFIARDGVEYFEANDPAEFGRVYTEGNPIPADEADLADKAEAFDILTGVVE